MISTGYRLGVIVQKVNFSSQSDRIFGRKINRDIAIYYTNLYISEIKMILKSYEARVIVHMVNFSS